MNLKLDMDYYETNKTKLIIKQAVYLLISFILVLVLNQINSDLIVSLILVLILTCSTTFISYIAYLTLQDYIELDTELQYDSDTGILKIPTIYFFGLVRVQTSHLIFLQFYEHTYTKGGKTVKTCILDMRLVTFLPSVKVVVTLDTAKQFYLEYKSTLKSNGIEVLYEEVNI